MLVPLAFEVDAPLAFELALLLALEVEPADPPPLPCDPPPPHIPLGQDMAEDELICMTHMKLLQKLEQQLLLPMQLKPRFVQAELEDELIGTQSPLLHIAPKQQLFGLEVQLCPNPLHMELEELLCGMQNPFVQEKDGQQAPLAPPHD